MRQISLGMTGLTVSEFGFGGIPIQRLSEDEAVAVVRRCLDLGVTFLDTANAYTTSEERIGRAIRGRREGLVLATKTGSQDAAGVREHLDLSLRRLGVDYIDLYQFHNVSSEEHFRRVLAPGGLLEAAHEARAAGRIRHIGVTSHSLDFACQLVETGQFETIMFPFCVAAPEPLEKLIPLCRRHGVGFIGMKPMGGGLLASASLAFKFLRQYPDLLPIVGIQEAWEIEEIAGIYAGDPRLSDDDRVELEVLQREAGARYCRGCDYCQPCPNEITISTVLRLKSFARRMPAERVFGPWGAGMIDRAAACAECGDCEARCPYSLPIRAMLKEQVIWFREQTA